jgi:YVTN family beta-propeller protein
MHGLLRFREDWQEELLMRVHTIRALCAVAAGAGAAILPLGLAGTAGAAASPACRTHPVIAYVVNQMSGTVTPIRTVANTAGKAINVGKYPYAVAITPNGKTAYVVNTFLNTVTPIRTATGTAGKPVPVGSEPWAVAITPDGRTAYVVSNGSDTVTPISILTGRAGKPISVGSAPISIAITP